MTTDASADRSDTAIALCPEWVVLRLSRTFPQGQVVLRELEERDARVTASVLGARYQAMPTVEAALRLSYASARSSGRANSASGEAATVR